MLFSYCIGQQQIDDNEKCWRTAGDFECHADAAVQHGAHRLMEHIQGFTQSHWMRHQVSACAVSPQRPPWLTNLLKQHKTLTKHNF